MWLKIEYLRTHDQCTVVQAEKNPSFRSGMCELQLLTSSVTLGKRFNLTKHPLSHLSDRNIITASPQGSYKEICLRSRNSIHGVAHVASWPIAVHPFFLTKRIPVLFMTTMYSSKNNPISSVPCSWDSHVTQFWSMKMVICWVGLLRKL